MNRCQFERFGQHIIRAAGLDRFEIAVFRMTRDRKRRNVPRCRIRFDFPARFNGVESSWHQDTMVGGSGRYEGFMRILSIRRIKCLETPSTIRLNVRLLETTYPNKYLTPFHILRNRFVTFVWQ